MLFSSIFFLYAFLPLFLGCYYLAPVRSRNWVGVIGGVLFYAWGEPVFVTILLAVAVVVYFVGLGIGRLPPEARAVRRALLALGLFVALGLFGYWKYANFLVAQLNRVLGLTGQLPLAWSKVMLPIGISFFTFQKISYLVDVYRGTTPPARNLRDFLLYVMLFPQLIAGPIIRYHDISRQIEHRDHTLDRFLSGLWRFFLGLGRKVLIANSLAAVAEKIFRHDVSSLPAGYAWLGLIAFAFQIYFDFAGYSDMAIGLARMMGFEFMENFNRPYTARTVTEFWRRWHISLSSFMREYLYIPLGGNRVGPARAMANLWIVFLASGFWHGASWNFVIWGACHGLLLTVEKLIGSRRLGQVPADIGVVTTFLLVLMTWIPFQDGLLGQGLSHSWHYAGRLVAFDSWPEAIRSLYFVRPEIIGNRAVFILILAAIVSFLPDRFWERLGLDRDLPGSRREAVFRTAFAAACVLLASASLAGQSYNPFIYMRF